MSWSLDTVCNPDVLGHFRRHFCSDISLRERLWFSHRCVGRGLGGHCKHLLKAAYCKKTASHIENGSSVSKAVNFWGNELNLPCVQTLTKFPREKLSGKIVLVRIDSKLLLSSSAHPTQSATNALSTIKYLHGAGAKVILASSWGQRIDLNLSTKYVADHLSSLLHLKVVPESDVSDFKSEAYILLIENLAKFKQEFSNCSRFAQQLSIGVSIFVNDAFSISHKILASTVGISRFCNNSVAGFHFEEEMNCLKEVGETDKQPYIAIIGGSNFLQKEPVLRALASKCNGILFLGNLAFQIMHALGVSVPLSLVESDAVRKAFELTQIMQSRNILVLLPRDFLCVSNSLSELHLQDVFPADSILTGWTPIDIGPNSVEEIYYFLSKCKKILVIGQVKYDRSQHNISRASRLTLMLEEISRNGCNVTIVASGAGAHAIVGSTENSLSSYNQIENASVVWEFLKGHTLPGVAALDSAYPFDLDWHAAFHDPSLPLVVDIGSGNGLFLLNMARRWSHINFLGLEINEKLVSRCQENIFQSCMKNGYFLFTNATHTFHSIVSSYPGKLILVSIQCPNPDFDKAEHRWRMVQPTLIQAIIDLLTTNGKIFLQSDVENVALRMKQQFLMYGKDVLVVDGVDDGGWMEENPFGVRSDWEQHVLDRGAPMYRVMLRKAEDDTNKTADPCLLSLHPLFKKCNSF